MLVRLAMPDDADALRPLAKAHMAEVTPSDVWDEEKAKASFERMITSGNDYFIVAEENREIIGYLSASCVEKPFSSGFIVYHELIYVRPVNRGGRAAAALLTEFNKWTDMLAPAEVIMLAANEKLDPRFGMLCKRYGFRAVGSVYQRIPS